MLEPDVRAALTEQLRPPAGFELLHAVGTTFTLDLTSALSVPLSFASTQLRETNDPLAILDAVRKSADRVDIFGQAGQISVPAQASDLVAFLEPMTHPVTARPGALFHPKVWVLEYGSGDERAYRLLCGSRNLTADRSWDLVVRLDGIPGVENRAGNLGIQEFFRALPRLCVVPLERARRQRVEQFADRLLTIEWELPAEIKELVFHPLGVGRGFDKNNFRGKRHLVISPFLSDDGIAGVTTRAREKPIVVSRAESFDRLLPETVAGIQMFVLDDSTRDPDALPDDPLVGLHAKAYAVDRIEGSRLFVGSANATQAAFGGNIEFLIELIGPNTKVGVPALVADDALGTLLIPYETAGGATETESEKADRQLDDAIRSLAAIQLRAVVRPRDDLYSMNVECARTTSLPDGTTADVQLITRRGNARSYPSPGNTAAFDALELADITPFIVIRVIDSRGENRTTVARAELVGDIAGRHDAVIARQLDSPEKFLKFLLLLLALNGADARAAMKVGSEGWGSWTSENSAGIFESLVRALATNPQSLDDLNGIVERMRENASWKLPAEFDDLWASVWKARKAQKAAR